MSCAVRHARAPARVNRTGHCLRARRPPRPLPELTGRRGGSGARGAGPTGSVLSCCDQTEAVILVDAANVIGSRPTGWWRDRAGAARTFVAQVRGAVTSERIAQPVVVVLEGKARQGAQPGLANGVTVQHAVGSGDDTLIDVVRRASGQKVTLVTADRDLRRRAEALGADVVGPNWLFERMES
jgi:hypothetical protein